MTPIQPPFLGTERLELEPLTTEHSNGMFELWSSPEVCAHSGPVVDWRGNMLSLPAATPLVSDMIIDFFEHMAAAGQGFRWAVLERTSGEFIGAIGFNSLGAMPELAYHQVPRFWGRGYMYEACESGLEWAGDQGAERVVAFIEPGNVRSARLAERLGFVREDDERDGAVRYERSRSAG